jgi:uncharacterized protein YtpQ (UPF0354 family)
MSSLPAAETAAKLSHLESPILTDLGNGLLVGYLVERETHFQYVQQRHLADGNWTEIALHRTGLSNLAALLRDTGAKVQPCGAVQAVFFNGTFEASLLLVDAFWNDHLAPFAPNGFIAAIPSRDVLAFCDAKSKAGVAELRQIVQRVQEGGDRPLTSALYRRVPPLLSWQPYLT